ncbi:30S ribosomal protein S20 [Caedimonas varicaedens]|jgi:small subunit ribosomal protein S20|uniref:Small ribosomal subunit protein bS20 n=1 Tax=Caedimonas varicaedens TaxID=1629334 RepID=A0A0K8MC27_9PROT|nr:30S ribosomal protein S20 [Caedimonas varicaedens]
MANIESAKKRVRQSVLKTARNHSRIMRVRTFVRKVEEAIRTGDKSVAQKALQIAQPEIMRGVSKGVLHLNTASRKVSRLASRINAL